MPARKVKEPVDPTSLRRSSRTRRPSTSSASASASATTKTATAPASKKQKTDKTEADEKVKNNKVNDETEEEEEEEEEGRGGGEVIVDDKGKNTTSTISDNENKDVKKPADNDDDEAAGGPSTEKIEPVDIPDVTVKDQDDNDVNLKDEIEANPYVVVFAYPKASTPGCTRQACGFRDEFPKFSSAKAVVFGLSADSVSAQKKFQDKQELPYRLLADVKYQLIGPLGAKKSPSGGITRSFWVFKDAKLVTKVIGVKPEVSVSQAVELVVGA
ncbi:thioredoxin-like protein [Lipomyces japonicus]|uniref:thioredoxin-like protein n=1 Tax=Lipomyces japonicus TaxID=56871 RepID=UPI0034CEAB94